MSKKYSIHNNLILKMISTCALIIENKKNFLLQLRDNKKNTGNGTSGDFLEGKKERNRESIIKCINEILGGIKL